MASKSADEIDLSMSSTPQNTEQQKQKQKHRQQQQQQHSEAPYLSQTSSRSLAPMAANIHGGHTAGGGAFPLGGLSPLSLSATEEVGGAAGTSSMLRQPAYGTASASYDSSITLGIDERNAAASMSLLRGDGSLDHLLQSTPRKKPPTDQQRMTQQQHPLFMSSPSPGIKFHQYMTHGSELKSSAAQLELEAALRSSGKRKDPLSSELRYGLNPSARSFVSLSSQQESTALKEFPFIFDGYSGWVCRHCSYLDHYHRGPNYSMKGEKPPPNDFVDKHLRFCPALNQRLPFDLGGMMAQGSQYNQIHMQHPREGEEKEVEYATPEEEKKPPRKRKDTSTWMSPTGGLGDMTPQAQKKQLIDLTDVPAQPPILKNNGKDGTSKYQGVTFVKATNEWRAQIMVDGKRHHIGLYDNEEQAGIDYARAMFKYRVGNHKRERRQHAIDLTDVPLQSLILNCGYGSSSKYEGVSLNKSTNKWKAQITISGKSRYIGTYDSEEEAAVDYARAVFKYSGDCRRQDTSKEKKGPKVIDVTNRCPTTAELLERSNKYQGRVKGNIAHKLCRSDG